MRLFVQPVLIYGADSAALSRALDRALTRSVPVAIYTAEMFGTFDDDANRAVVRTVERANLNLVGIGFRADRKVADKIVDKLTLHE